MRYAALALLLLSTSADAMTGAEMRQACRESPDFCLGYVGGVFAMAKVSPDMQGVACVPDGAILFDLPMGYALSLYDEHPSQMRFMDAREVVLAAIVKHWPCR